MTMGMAASSMATKMTAGVPSEQAVSAVSAAEACLVRRGVKTFRRMSTAKQVKAA